MHRVTLIAVAVALLCAGAAPDGRIAADPGPRVDVVVRLTRAPLAGETGSRTARLLADEQSRFLEALRSTAPGAAVNWRYRLVLNGFALSVPRADVSSLARLPGVREVIPSVPYRLTARATSGSLARAAAAAVAEAGGEGVKIAVVDDGVYQQHPYFDPAGYTMPPGFPRGQRAFTTAKVIVARAFPPPRARWQFAGRPFDPRYSGHGTHVAGIAAGNAGTRAEGRTISGIAPRAYIGNYKAYTMPTDSGFGLTGNSPEVVAAIEAAVADGMDVINASFGEPEIEPSRDLIALALDAAARAGVVPVVAAGNDFASFGRGSVGSPGTSQNAITVGALESSGSAGTIAGFSAAGPTPLSLRLKPDVAAPGVDILSSVPDGWARFSGTSMASPHVAGTVAVLLERHPRWTPAQVKAALTATALPVPSGSSGPAPPTRAGGGAVNLARADEPLLFTSPSAVSFGLLRPGQTADRVVSVTEAGGVGTWLVSVQVAEGKGAVKVTAPTSMTVPGQLVLTAAAGSADGEVSGVVVLSRGSQSRRVPFWAGVARASLAGHSVRVLRAPGTYTGNTQGRPSRVAAYRYPSLTPGGALSARLTGPEQVFRVRLARPTLNFGVAITGRGPGVAVEPRLVRAGEEDRLLGHGGLPVNINPYLQGFGSSVLAAGAVRAVAGEYDIVFDSPTPRGAGRFTFRYWINDRTPPTARVASGIVRRGSPIRVRVADAQAGIDPSTLRVTLDGKAWTARVRGGVVRIPTGSLTRGRHVLRLQVSDFQESRNTENVLRILPNTRRLTATITVR